MVDTLDTTFPYFTRHGIGEETRGMSLLNLKLDLTLGRHGHTVHVVIQILMSDQRAACFFSFHLWKDALCLQGAVLHLRMRLPCWVYVNQALVTMVRQPIYRPVLYHVAE